jgi:LPS export ABC transporter protein LptC
MNWRTPYTLLLITLAVLAFMYVWNRDTEELTNNTASTPRGYYLSDALIRQTGTNGAARYSLRAQKIEQDPTNDQISLSQVELDYHGDSGARWLLSAAQGRLDQQAEQAEFSGNVLIRPVSDARHTAQLHTDALHVDFKQQRASTASLVTLQIDRQQLTARGLVANLKEQSLKLESQVHGVFTITPTPP